MNLTVNLMIKKNLILVSFLLLSLWSEAQTTTAEQETVFGVTAGYSNVNFKAEEGYPLLKVDENPGINDSFFVGIFAEVPLGLKTLFKPEVNYFFANNSKGYLEISPLFKYYLFNSGFSVLVGPQIRFITGTLSNNYKRTGFEASVGLGYDFKRFSVQAKYAYEFTNRYKEDVEPTGGLEMHFETFSVGIGYKF